MEIKLDQILFQIINFGVVFGALTYFLYKPIVKLLDERARKVAEGMRAAEQSMTERSQVEAMKKTAKAQAEKDAAKHIEEAKKQAEQLKRELTAKMKAELAQERDRVVAAWAQEREQMLAKMHKEFATAVTTVAGKVAEASIDEQKHKTLIDKGIEELARSL